MYCVELLVIHEADLKAWKISLKNSGLHFCRNYLRIMLVLTYFIAITKHSKVVRMKLLERSNQPVNPFNCIRNFHVKLYIVQPPKNSVSGQPEQTA